MQLLKQQERRKWTGFAVVADEIRTLAQRTQESTPVSDATHAIETLNDISISVDKIYQLNTSIASASEEQAAVSNTISQSVTSITEMAKETANQSNEADQSSSQIHNISTEPQSLIASYKF